MQLKQQQQKGRTAGCARGVAKGSAWKVMSSQPYRSPNFSFKDTVTEYELCGRLPRLGVLILSQCLNST